MSNEVTFPAGCHISKAAGMLVDATCDHGEAHGTFNGVKLRASPSSTVNEIVADYGQQVQAASVAWRNSPEGEAAERERERSALAAQEKHDVLMQDLATLDFKNDVAVLDWLCAIQDATDHISVSVRKAEILETFSRHGFEPSVNCGDAFDADSRENVFRYLVGQALDSLKSVAIHGIIHKFAAEWKAKFVEVAQ